MATVTILYPRAANFDMAYYKATHMPLVQEQWGPLGLKSWKILRIPDDSAAYGVKALLDWDSLEAFKKAAAGEAGRAVLGDVPNFSDRQPVILAAAVEFTS